jgi:hypothetical protein
LKGTIFDALFPGRLLSVCSLLPHEQRMSVLNMAVRQSPLSSLPPVKSKVSSVEEVKDGEAQTRNLEPM